MRIEDFPSCCSAKALVALNDINTSAACAKKLIALLTPHTNMKMIVATTVDTRKFSEDALHLFGFKRTKRRFVNPAHWHGVEKLCLWFASPQEIIAACKLVK